LTLAPGEAVFLPPGHLHAYLRGTAVELMGASDNVVRGGFTAKYVDVPELLRVVRFEVAPADPIQPVPVSTGVVTWPVPVPDLALHRVRLDAGVRRAELALPGPRTVLCLAGELVVGDGADPVTLRPGEAAFGAGGGEAAGRLWFTGSGEAFVASVGLTFPEKT
jgi:mannose-6-phosphate isomerase